MGDKGSTASLAITNTILAPSAGGIVTFVLLFRRLVVEDKGVRMDFQGLANGLLAGLVSVTASCNDVEPWAALIIGAFGAVFYCLACRLLNCLRVDDPLEAAQVHGFGGIWGCIATAFFKKKEGVFYEGENSVRLLGVQFLGVLIIISWSAILSGIFFGIARYFDVLRIPEESEILGCDIYYFSPIEFQGTVDQFDIKSDIEMVAKPFIHQMENDSDKLRNVTVEECSVQPALSIYSTQRKFD